MAVKANANDAAQSWVNAMQNAGPKYTAGVEAVRTAPGQLAAARQDFWASQVAAAKPKFAANVAKVSLTSWQQAASTKGATRLGSGASAAQPKMTAFMNSFLPALTNIVNGLPARGTFEQNLSRFTNYAQALHAQKGNF